MVREIVARGELTPPKCETAPTIQTQRVSSSMTFAHFEGYFRALIALARHPVGEELAGIYLGIGPPLPYASIGRAAHSPP